MKLKKILQIHDAHSSKQCLVDNLGDGYLLKMNPIFRKVREEALKAKFKMSNQRFGDYDAFALTQLPRILAERKIPYVDNVRPLREIEKVAPNTFSLATIPPLKGNQIFHESAHAVAHAMIQKTIPSVKKAGLAGERELALRVLLEESFANACESIANAYATSEEHDEFLFKNSYVMETEALRNSFRKALEAFGFSPIFRLMTLSFLHANFLRTGEIEKSLIRSIRLAFAENPQAMADLSTIQIKLLTRIFKAGLDLDTDFTEFTGGFCLRLLGIKTELRKLLHFDFLTIFENDAKTIRCFSQLTQAIRPD